MVILVVACLKPKFTAESIYTAHKLITYQTYTPYKLFTNLIFLYLITYQERVLLYRQWATGIYNQLQNLVYCLKAVAVVSDEWSAEKGCRCRLYSSSGIHPHRWEFRRCPRLIRRVAALSISSDCYQVLLRKFKLAVALVWFASRDRYRLLYLKSRLCGM